MSAPIYQIDLGHPSLLEFTGPDAVRFLNGQITQDVRRLVGTDISLPACVTDAKGRLQFRVSITAVATDSVWLSGLAEWQEALEARLTRYLIADEVEVSGRTGAFRLIHFTGVIAHVPAGVIARHSRRFGVPGVDWWIPDSMDFVASEIAPVLTGDALEAFRIAQGIPAWGRELTEGMLPPEALLENSDISYQKGCYIGQEVISRIKSAGKVNRYLTKFSLPPEPQFGVGNLQDASGRTSGELTSISPEVTAGARMALGYAKRTSTEFFLPDAAGESYPAARI